MSWSKSRAGSARQLLPWLLIASTPVVFALATWDPAGIGNPIQKWLRAYGVVVLGVEILVIVCAFASGFEPLRTRRQAPRWALAALSLLLAVGLYTAQFVAPDGLAAMGRTFMWLVHLLFGLAVAFLAASASPSALRHVWPAIAAGLVGYALLLALYVGWIADPAGFDWFHFRLAVINIRQVGFYSATGAAAALGIAFVSTRWSAFLAGAAASALLALSFWSGTRGSVLALWMACAAGLVWFPALRSLRVAGILFASTIVGAFLSLVHSVPNPHFGVARITASAVRETAEEVSSGRFSTWAGTYEAILKRPLFGYGESQFRLIVPESLGEYNHPHNVVLQVLLQWGVVGGLCFFALAGLLAWRCHLALQSREKSHIPAFLVLASLLTMSLYEGTLYHPYPIMMIAVATALIIAAGQGQPDLVKD